MATKSLLVVQIHESGIVTALWTSSLPQYAALATATVVVMRWNVIMSGVAQYLCSNEEDEGSDDSDAPGVKRPLHVAP